MNEAQLINPQGINRNMATRDKLLVEWLEHGGKIIYNDNQKTVVVEGEKEYLIKYNEIIIHLTVDRVLVIAQRKRFISVIPLRGRPRGMNAVRTARTIIMELPPEIVERIGSVLPRLLTLVARV